MTIADRQLPALLDAEGAVMHLDTSVAVSADEAGRILPKLGEAIRQAHRYKGFLEDALSADMGAKSQTERLIDGTLWSLKGEAVWQVTNEGAMALALEAAAVRGDITDIELMHAMEREVTVRFNQTAINTLVKRIPELDLYRTRVTSDPKLKVKSSK